MPGKTEIGILLFDPVNEQQVGFIRFDGSGMLVYQPIKARLHTYAFRSIHLLLTQQWFKRPLYKKHANLLNDRNGLPETILQKEAQACEEFLSSQEKPLKLDGRVVKAKVVFTLASD